MDWIGHHGDIAHWGLGFDLTGPSEIDGYGDFPAANALWNTARIYSITCTYRKEVTHYAGDVTMVIAGGHPGDHDGDQVDWERRLGVGRPGRIRRFEPGWIKPESLPEESAQGKALRVGGAPAEFSGQREVAQADDHAGADGASLDDSGSPGIDFDDGGPEAASGTWPRRRSKTMRKPRPCCRGPIGHRSG